MVRITREVVLGSLETEVRGYSAPRRRWKSALHRLTEDLLNEEHDRMTNHCDPAWDAYMLVVHIIEELEDAGLIVVSRQYESMGRCLGNPTYRIALA
jgi:hypothetical protein